MPSQSQQPQILQCQTCNATGKVGSGICNECLGVGYTATDGTYEYYLEIQGENVAIFDIKNPVQYRGALKQQAQFLQNIQANSSNASQQVPQFNQQNVAQERKQKREIAQKVKSLTQDEVKAITTKFMSNIALFTILFTLLGLLLVYSFKIFGNVFTESRIIYLIIVTTIILFMYLFFRSRFARSIKIYLSGLLSTPSDYRKWLNDKRKHED